VKIEHFLRGIPEGNSPAHKEGLGRDKGGRCFEKLIVHRTLEKATPAGQPAGAQGNKITCTGMRKEKQNWGNYSIKIEGLGLLARLKETKAKE